jgi:hypothetical protein
MTPAEAALLRTLETLTEHDTICPEGVRIWDEGRWKFLTLEQVAQALHEAIQEAIQEEAE